MKINKIKGLIAPVFTPMYQNGEIALEKIADYGDYIIEKDLGGVFIAGSSGEGMLLSTKERKAVMEEWAPFDSEDFKLIVHVGHTSYKEAQDLALHAQDNNAFAISAMGPVFLQTDNVDSLVDYFSKIAEVVPETPFYYYHIPVRTGSNINMVRFLEAATQRIPNFAGIKYTHSNLMEMQQCMMFDNGRLDILHGSDVTLMTGHLLGVEGAIGTTYNFASEWYKELMTALDRGHILSAREIQARIVKLNELLSTYGGGIVAGKAILKLTGIDCGPCRAPLKTLDQAGLAKLREELVKIGLIN